MSWRTVCITKRCKLEYRMGFMIIRTADETQKIHTSEIGVLIIENTAISLTASLLNELNRVKAKIIFCDELHNPYGEIIPYYGSHDTSKCIRNQVNWSQLLKDQLWQNIIQNKIMKQSQNLLEKGYIKEALLLDSYIPEVIPGDKTNREGHAAKVYFNAIFGKKFTRDSDDVINACLNYTYSLLLAIFNREIVSAGRLTQIGIWHNNMFNHFNLSSDLMEEFRPIIDRFVFDLDYEKYDYLTADLKLELLKALEIKVNIDDKVQIIPNAIKIYCQRIFRILDNNSMNNLAKIDYV